MPYVNSANVGAGQNQPAYTAGEVQNYALDPTLTAPVPVGSVVQLNGYTPSPAITGDGQYNYPTVVPSSETPDNLLLGVVVGGPSLGTPPYPPLDNTDGGGVAVSVAMVMTQGICQILCDATTDVGDSLIQSAETVGAAAPGTSELGQTVGVALQAVTITSGTALVWAYVRIV